MKPNMKMKMRTCPVCPNLGQYCPSPSRNPDVNADWEKGASAGSGGRDKPASWSGFTLVETIVATCIAAIMELLNDLYAAEAQISAGAMRQVLERLVLLLGPFTPYIAEEMWEELGKPGPVFKQPWPAYDPELAREELAEVVVQINGKLRSRIHVAFGTSKEDLERIARQEEKVQPLLEGKQIVKAVIVPDKLVNLVVK